MIKKHGVSCTLIVSLLAVVMALALLPSTFLRLQNAWADSVIATIPVGTFPQNLAFDSDNGDMYVTNEFSGTVSVIDGSTNTVVKTIDVGRNPHGVAFDSDNGDMYVTNLVSETVSVIDGSTNTVVKTIPIGIGPQAVAFDSDNGDMYVVNSTPDAVSVIDGSTNTVVKIIDVGQSPQALAFDPGNGNMYVANWGSNTVSVIDGSTNTVVKTIDVGRGPQGVAFDSSNGNMYVANGVSNTVSVIDGSTNTVVKTIPVDRTPLGIAFNPANHNMYVANAASDTVSVIDGSTNTVVESIPVGEFANPRGIAFNPNNNYMYVTNGGFSTVSVIATSTPIQPPTQTTITSATDGNGNAVQDGGSTVSTSITFKVTATPGTNPIAGFECSLDGSPFSSCASTNPATIDPDNLAAGQQHTFEVRAVDTQGNKDPDPDTFSWTVLTPQQATQKVISTIDSMHLSRGTTTSLEAPLDAAIRQLNRNNDVAACNLLNAFLDQVDQRETNGQLTPQQAADLRQQATAIQDELGCSSSSSSSSSSPSSSISGVVGSIVNSTTIHDINPKGLMTTVNPNEIIHQPSSSSSLLPLPSLQSLP